MNPQEVVDIAKLVWSIVGPIATAMVEACVNGEDPLAVLSRERVEAILPAELKSELALRAAKARGRKSP